ncbi:uncharacterized protein TNCT_598961 [Trichonephila clavata]|uniref:Uncharacterized protein n=1 Tax=Trichonephila clavata TaxID=2740835 RepID=A0A8X6LA65_TRICU|nr:uncharacterized protein TNCT_598961 [Trichonephila clavata]
MAAARHQCTCLISHHKQKFAAQGGNIQWLKGFVFASEILEHPEECQDTGNNNVVSDIESSEEVAQETVEELMEKMSLLQKKEKESSGEEQKNGNTSDLPSALDAQFECDMGKFIDDDITFTRRAFSIADGHMSDFIIQDCTWMIMLILC